MAAKINSIDFLEALDNENQSGFKIASRRKIPLLSKKKYYIELLLNNQSQIIQYDQSCVKKTNHI